MKLKFRAEGKDWVIFGIFSVILLYLVAIAVLNLSYFANYSRLWGLNPFPAFGKQYLLATIVGFFGALAAMFVGVSSYFFERDKGFGISAEPKKEKGYSHWASDKEFQKELNRVKPGEKAVDKAGIPLRNNGKDIWVDAGEYHNLIIGSTGSGKTEMIVQPMVKILAKKGESMIITDPKGEIYEKNAVELREKGYNVVLLNFRNPQNGNQWNPLSLPYNLYRNGNSDKANELLDDLAVNILYDEKAQNQDPFWEKTSADYFAGLTLGLFEDAKEEEINLNSINLMTTVGEEKCGPSTYVKEYFSFKDPSSPEYINVSSTLMAPSDTKSSILSVFKQKIKLFSSRENLSEMLGHSDFDMSDIGRKKTAVFIVIQDEKKTYHSLVTIFLKQCYETLIDVAQENGRELPYKTNFILDEFANMPPLKDVTTMVTAARSRAIRFTFIIQNFAQLYQVYGKENGETIKGNCGNIIYLISSELAALEEISKMCGEVKSKDKDKTASTPLVTVSDLQRMPKGSIIVLRTRMMPFKTKLMYNWQMEAKNLWGDSYPKASYPERERGSVALFDLKKFVDIKKDEKINQMLSNMASGSSSSSGGRPIPRPTSSGLSGVDINDFFKKVDEKLAQSEHQSQNNLEMPSPVPGGLTNEEKDSIKSSVREALSNQIKPTPVPGSLTDEEKNSIKSSVKEALSNQIKPTPTSNDIVADSSNNIVEPTMIDDDIKKQKEEADRLQKEHEEAILKEQMDKKVKEEEEQKRNEELKKLEISAKERETKLQEEKKRLEDIARQEELAKEEAEKNKAIAETKRLEEEKRIAEENAKIEKMRKENEQKESELKALENKRKAQEQELLDAIKKQEEIDKTKPIEVENKPKVTEDQFFDDFFNDDDE